jgi:hypothetical protein
MFGEVAQECCKTEYRMMAGYVFSKKCEKKLQQQWKHSAQGKEHELAQDALLPPYIGLTMGQQRLPKKLIHSASLQHHSHWRNSIHPSP